MNTEENSPSRGDFAKAVRAIFAGAKTGRSADLDEALRHLEAALVTRERLVAESESRLAQRERDLAEMEALLIAREKLLKP